MSMLNRTRKHLRVHRPGLLLAALLCCASLLSGCGQKGPLILPQDDTEQSDEQ